MTLDSTQLFFKLCSDHLSIEAIPRKKVNVDLSRVKKRLDEFNVTLWTPHFVVMKSMRGEEITLRKDGRMIIRKAASEKDAEASATRVLFLISQL